MQKYWHVINLGIQNTLVYRVNFFLRALFNLVPLTATIALWQAIYADKSDDVAGYARNQMVSYYLLVTIIDMLTAVTEDDWQIAADIKDGAVSQFLIRPIDYLGYRLCLFASGRLIYTLAAAGPVLLFIYCQRQFVVAPPDLMSLVVFVLAVIQSAVLQFLLSYLTALMAFWVLEISTFVFILLALQRLVSGQMFPLDILPPQVEKCLLLTPFPYQMFFPISVYLGRLSGLEMIAGLLLQASWVGICYWLARWLWKEALKTYAAVGG